MLIYTIYIYIIIVIDPPVGPVTQDSSSFQRIFALLASHHIDDAVTVALEASLFHLSTILAQVDGNEAVSQLLREQLAVWVEHDVYIPEDLLAIYRMLAALPTRLGPVEHVYNTSTLSELTWVRSIGVFYWYCRQSIQYDVDGQGCVVPDSVYAIQPMEAALIQYRMALADGDAMYPFPHYINNNSNITNNSTSNNSNSNSMLLSATTSKSDYLYNLLEVLYSYNIHTKGHNSDPENMLSYLFASLQCENNNSNSPLDYHISYLTMIFLQGSELLPFHDQDDTVVNREISEQLYTCVCIIRQHVISQLLGSGQWIWAVYISLTIHNTYQREYMINSIIQQYAPIYIIQNTNTNTNNTSNSTDLNVLLSTYDYNLLTDQLQIPERLIYGSLAVYYGTNYTSTTTNNATSSSMSSTANNMNIQCNYYYKANMIEQGNELIGQYIGPLLLLKEGDIYDTTTATTSSTTNINARVSDSKNNQAEFKPKIKELYELLLSSNLTFYNTILTNTTTNTNSTTTNITNSSMYDDNYIGTPSEIILSYLYLTQLVKASTSTTTTTTTATTNNNTGAGTGLKEGILNKSGLGPEYILDILQLSKWLLTRLSYTNTNTDTTNSVCSNNSMLPISISYTPYTILSYRISAYVTELLEQINRTLIDSGVAQNSTFPLFSSLGQGYLINQIYDEYMVNSINIESKMVSERLSGLVSQKLVNTVIG